MQNDIAANASYRLQASVCILPHVIFIKEKLSPCIAISEAVGIWWSGSEVLLVLIYIMRAFAWDLVHMLAVIV